MIISFFDVGAARFMGLSHRVHISANVRLWPDDAKRHGDGGNAFMSARKRWISSCCRRISIVFDSTCWRNVASWLYIATAAIGSCNVGTMANWSSDGMYALTNAVRIVSCRWHPRIHHHRESLCHTTQSGPDRRFGTLPINVARVESYWIDAKDHHRSIDHDDQ